MSTVDQARQATFRATVEAILNSIDRFYAGEFIDQEPDRPLSPDLKVRFAVVCSPGTPRDIVNVRWDLILTDTPRKDHDYYPLPLSRVGAFWLKCDDREFLLGLANVGNAYLEISKP